MNKLVIAIIATLAVGAAIVGFQAARAHHAAHNDTAPTTSFEAWKAEFNFTYGGPENVYRKAIFQNNLQKIEEHNAKASSYKLGLTQFAAQTREEFAAINLGYKGHKSANRTANTTTKNATAIPAAIDWTTKGAVTPVKNQGQCGSCWAFSTTGALEGLNAIHNGNLLSFSEQQLVDCSASFGNQGCNGGLMDQGFQYVQANGIVGETAYPYKGVDGRCKIPAGNKFKNGGFQDVTVNNPDALKAALANGPVSVAIEADQDAFQLYKGGVITGDACGTQLDHGVLAVGYGVDGKNAFYKVKNSWGASWGEAGFVRIGVAAGAGVCGIQQSASYPTA